MLGESTVDAFWELGSHRAIASGAIGQIPRGVIREYGVERGFDADELRAFVYFVRQCDAEYCELLRQEHESARAKAEAEAKNKPPRSRRR